MGTHCGHPLRVNRSSQKLQTASQTSISSNLEHERTQDTHESPNDPLEKLPINRPNSLLVPIEPLILASKEDVRKSYHILPEIIGKGQFSSVRRASFPSQSQTLATSFALKSTLLNPKDQHQASLLKNELFILRKYPHPRIVSFFEAYQDPKFLHLLLEDLQGGSLLSYILGFPNGKIPEKKAARMLFGVFSAVRLLHKKGVVHRDLKPENLLFLDKGHSILKLIDFGLSKQQTDLTQGLKTIVGSPYYIAPEILRNIGYGPSCDVWSLGTILFLMLIGKPPFYNESVKELFRLIQEQDANIEELGGFLSLEARDLLKKMLKKDPKERITIGMALKHRFFSNMEPEVGSYGIELFKGILNSMKKGIKLEGNRVLEVLRQEEGLQKLSNENRRILNEVYSILDRKLKGEINLKGFKKALDYLDLNWNERDIKDFFVNCNKRGFSKENISFHMFELAFVNSLEGNIKGVKNKEEALKALERRMIEFKEEELEGIDWKEVWDCDIDECKNDLVHLGC